MGSVCEIGSVKKDLEALEEYTKHLPSIKDLVSPAAHPQSGYQQYDIIGGKAFGFNLLNIGTVAVQRLEVSKGAIFPDHKHTCRRGGPVVEYGVVFEGQIRVKNLTTGEEDIFGPGDLVILKPGEIHSGEAITDVSLINITVPAAEGYPENGHITKRINARNANWTSQI